jgi:hypothetical protein
VKQYDPLMKTLSLLAKFANCCNGLQQREIIRVQSSDSTTERRWCDLRRIGWTYADHEAGSISSNDTAGAEYTESLRSSLHRSAKKRHQRPELYCSDPSKFVGQIPVAGLRLTVLISKSHAQPMPLVSYAPFQQQRQHSKQHRKRQS